MIRTITLLLVLSPCLLMAQMWESIAPMPSGKHHPVTFTLDGMGYAITGTEGVRFATDDVFQYDPINDQWNTLNDFPGAERSFAIGQAYNGKGYLGFGFANGSYFNDIWEYDPATDSWKILTVCDCIGRRHPAFVIKNDKIFVGLGDGIPGDLADWHVYDMVNDTWNRVNDIPGDERHHPFMFPAGDDMYVGMGHHANLIYKDWYKFDVDTETWEVLDDFPGEARVAGTQFGHAGKGYVLSGDGDNHDFMATGEFWEYEPSTDAWTELTAHPGISLWAPGSFVIDGTVYFLGGQNRQTNVIQNTAWKYELTPQAPSSIAALKQVAEVNIYPNPAKDVLYIQSEEVLTRVRLISMTGMEVLETSNASTINISPLSPGIYFVQGQTTSGASFTQKVMIQ